MSYVATPKTDKPTLEEKRALAPPSPLKANPPDDINKDSILNSAAPTLSEIDHMPQSSLSMIMEFMDIPHVERRITLLARLVIEDALWNSKDLTRKERADFAFNAIRVLEGTKSTLWVEDPSEKNIPKTKEAMLKEKKRTEDRLERLLKNKLGLKSRKLKEVAEVAVEVVENESSHG